MAVKEITLPEIEFSLSSRTQVTFSQTQSVDWAEPGVFTVYIDVQHENGEAEVIELLPNSPYVTYGPYTNISGTPSLEDLLTVRIFNKDGQLGVLGDATETVRAVVILSAATKKYIESDFVGFDQENLTADDLELELKKRDLGELYLSNRESRVRASTDHTLSNLPIDINNPSNEPEDVAASRRQIALALVKEGAAFIDNTPVALTTTNEDGTKNVRETSTETAASRRALAQAIDDATIEVTVNIPQREGVDVPGTFKLQLEELHSGDVSGATATFIDTTYALPSDIETPIIWLDPGQQTTNAHPTGGLIPISLRQLRAFDAIAAGDAVTLDSTNSFIFRDVIADGANLYVGRTATFGLVVATSGTTHSLLPLKIYAMTANGAVTVDIGSTGDIQAITPGRPGTDTEDRNDRIVWVRNQNRQSQANGERDGTRDLSIMASGRAVNGFLYTSDTIDGVAYVWKSDATATNIARCFRLSDDTAVPLYDITGTTSGVNLINFTHSTYKGLWVSDENNKLFILYNNNFVVFDITSTGMILDATSAVAQGLKSVSPIPTNDKCFLHGNYIYGTSSHTFLGINKLKRWQVFGPGANGSPDSNYEVTINTTITAPTGTQVADSNSTQRLKRIGDLLIYINNDSDAVNQLTPVYNISQLAAGGTVSPQSLVDLTSVASTRDDWNLILSDGTGTLYFDLAKMGTTAYSANSTINLAALYFGPITVVDTTYHGVSLEFLVQDLRNIVAEAIAGDQVVLDDTDLDLDESFIDSDGRKRSTESPNAAPSRRSVTQVVFDALSGLSIDAIIDVPDDENLPRIAQEEPLPDSIMDYPDNASTYAYIDVNGVARNQHTGDVAEGYIAYNANAVAIYQGEVYVKEQVPAGIYHEDHVDWRGYADPDPVNHPTINSGGQYIGAFRTEQDLPASRADHDYWYDYGDHHWYIQFGNSSEYVDEDGNPMPGVSPTYVLWTSGPQPNNAASPFNPGISNHFPGSWKRETSSRAGATNRVRGNDQLYFFDGIVNTSYNYVDMDAPFYISKWEKLSDLKVGDIIPYLDGALGGDEWRSGLTSEALIELTDRVAANELELDALDGVVAATDQHEESINTMSSGNPNSSGTIKQKLSVDMSNAEASRIRTQHLADEAKYGRGQYQSGATYEVGQSAKHLGVLYWAVVRITNAQLTPDVDSARWTTTEDTRADNALSFEGIPLHADEIIYVDIGPRIDGITDDYFVAGSETTNHNSVGKVYNIPASSNSAFAEVGSFLSAAPTTSKKQFEGLCHHIARIDVGGVPTIYEYLFSPYAEYAGGGNTGTFRVHGMIKDGDTFTTAGVDIGTATSYISYNPTRQSSVMGIDIISVAADGLSFVVGVISSDSLDGDGFAQVELFTQTYTIDALDGSLILSGQTSQILAVPPSFIAEAMASPADNVVSIVGVDSLAIDDVYEVKSYSALDGSAIEEYNVTINSVRPVMSGHDHTDYITGFTAEGLAGSLIEFKISIPQIDTQTGTPRDSGGGIYGFERSGLAKQVIDNTHSIERSRARRRWRIS